MIRFTRHADNKFLLLKKHGLSIKRDQVIKTVEQPAYMNKKINKIELRYEPEADVLSWEINSDPIDYAKEMGNIVVHFSKKNIPVLIEILEAKKFLRATGGLLGKKQASVRRLEMAA